MLQAREKSRGGQSTYCLLPCVAEGTKSTHIQDKYITASKSSESELLKMPGRDPKVVPLYQCSQTEVKKKKKKKRNEMGKRKKQDKKK